MFRKRLYPKIYTEQNLNDTWNKVKSNKGVAGVDDMDIARFGKNIFPNLSRIQEELRRGSYAVKPIKEIRVKKKDGRGRVLGILTVEDRIVQRVSVGNSEKDRYGQDI